MDDRPLRVLSIDGGGIRGIIPARVLAAYEEMAGAPVAKTFDFVGGTSTGGLLALALAIPKDHGEVPVPAAQLVSLYQLNARRIFPKSLRRKFKLVRASHEPLAKVLREYVGRSRLSDSLVDLMIPAYEMERRQPFFFKSWRAAKDPQWDFSAVDAGLSACSAPVFFDPWKIRRAGARTRTYTLMDGGIFANNPALCMVVEARRRFPGRPINLLSVGTGDLKLPAPEDQVKEWSVLDWGRRGFGIVSDAVSEAVAYHVQQMEGVNQVRLQTPIPQSAEAMDNGDTENLQLLLDEAETLIKKRSAKLESFAADSAR